MTSPTGGGGSYRQALRDLTTLLRALARQGEITTQQMNEFRVALTSLSESRFGVQNYDQMIQRLNHLATALRNAGFEAESVISLREALLGLGAAHRQYTQSFRDISAGVVSPIEEAVRRTNLLFDQLNKPINLTSLREYADIVGTIATRVAPKNAIIEPASIENAAKLSVVTQQTVAHLRHLQNTGRLTSQEFREFSRTLNAVGRQGFGVQNYEQLVDVINRLSTALHRAGESSQEVETLRAELLRLGASYPRFNQSYRQLAAGADVEQEIRQRLRLYTQQTPGGTQAEASLKRQIELLQVQLDIRREIDTQITRTTERQIATTGPGRGGTLLRQPAAQEDPNVLRANQDFYDSLPFAARNVDILRTRLDKLGLTNAIVTRSTTELSTGITTLQFRAEAGGGRFRTFTAHLDRTGTILDDTQKRFRTFGDAIVRDTVEVLKWTVAIGLIYGPLRQLNALMTEARDIQSELADVQITLGEQTGSLGKVFRSATQIADETSTSVAGVIDGYAEAAAATGSIEDQSQRAATTQALLRDSMVLASLAGIDQKEALDTLVGALRQAGLELHQGVQILDSWVAVSRNANVSLNQLASTYAIVGTAAEDAGITADQLNAIVGTLAEATKLSADEVGNAIRGFISGFQSAKAEQTLARFGIAVRNVRGEVRSFTDLMQELAVLSQEGVLSQREISEITNVIGGGFRRGAQLAALLENYNRVVQLTAVSADAQGEAAQALQIRMDTLDAAITRLGNSFSALAQTMGQEGGALSLMTGFANAIGSVIDGITRLVEILGPAAPLLAALSIVNVVGRTGTARRYLESQIPFALSYLFSPTTAQLGPQAQLAGLKVPPGAGLAGGNIRAAEFREGAGGNLVLTPVTYSQFIGELTRRMNEGFANIVSKIGLGRIAPLGIGGLITPAIIGGTALAQGQPEKAGAVMGASLLTAIATGGSTIWTAAGAILAAAFYDTFLTYEGDLTDRWSEVLIEAERQRGKDTGQEEDRKTLQERLETEVVDSLNLWEKFVVNARTLMVNLWSNLQQAQGQAVTQPQFGGPITPGLGAGTNFTQQDIVTLLYQRKQGLSPLGGGPLEDFLLGTIAPIGGKSVLGQDTIQAVSDLLGDFLYDAIENGLVETETQAKIVTETTAIEELAAETAQMLVGDALDEIAQSQGGAIERYLTATQSTGAIALAAANVRVAIEKAQETGFEVPVPSRPEAVKLVSRATEEERQVLTQLTGDITILTEQIKLLNDQPILDSQELDKLDELTQKLEQSKRALADLLPAIERAAIIREVEAQVKPIIDLPEKTTPEQAEQILQLAESFWDDVLAHYGISEQQAEVFKEAQKEQLVRIGTDIIAATKVPQANIQQAIQELGIGVDTFQFTDVRDKFAKQDIPQLVERYARLVSAFKTVPGFELQPTDQTLVLKDGFETLHLDMRLWSLLMNDLIDIEKDKGLEGIFNLPEGATFWVPVSAFELDRATRARGAGGGFAGFDKSFFDQFAPDPEAIADAFGKELQTAGLTAAELKAQDVFNTPIETLRQIVREGIQSPEERQALGAKGVAQFLPVEDLKTALQELGVKLEEPVAIDSLERLGAEGNSYLLNIYNQLQTMTTNDQITNTQMQTLLQILAAGPQGPTSGVRITPSETGIPQQTIIRPEEKKEPETLPFPTNITKPLIEGMQNFDWADFGQKLLQAIIGGITFQPESLAPGGGPEPTSQAPVTTAPTALEIPAPVIEFPPELIRVLQQTTQTPEITLPEPEVAITLPEITLPPLQLPAELFTRELAVAEPPVPETPDLRAETSPSPINLQIESSSQVQLIVDGRVLADIIKPYVYEDFLRAETLGPGAIRRTIVA